MAPGDLGDRDAERGRREAAEPRTPAPGTHQSRSPRVCERDPSGPAFEQLVLGGAGH